MIAQKNEKAKKKKKSQKFRIVQPKSINFSKICLKSQCLLHFCVLNFNRNEQNCFLNSQITTFQSVSKWSFETILQKCQ